MLQRSYFFHGFYFFFLQLEDFLSLAAHFILVLFHNQFRNSWLRLAASFRVLSLTTIVLKKITFRPWIEYLGL